MAGEYSEPPFFTIFLYGNMIRGCVNNRQGFSHRDADEKSLLDEALRRGMAGAAHCECFRRALRERLMRIGQGLW